jgi:lipid-binding SYLF domain-containing protein
MNLTKTVTVGVLALALSASGAFAASKAEKQAEVRKVAATSLQEFYKADPKLKERVEKAPGYAVFSTFGISFLLGGAGGKGLVHDNKTRKDVFMHLAQASAGVQAGIAQSRTLIIFKTAEAMNNFIAKGWEFGGGGVGGASVDDKGLPGGGSGENLIADAMYYTLTRNGLQGGGAVAGTKVWRDNELN